MTAEFEAVFAQIKTILESYVPQLIIEHNTPENYYLNTTRIGPNKKPLFFGAVQIMSATIGVAQKTNAGQGMF
jgi:hypothetical protein